jgi:hypothetical protein
MTIERKRLANQQNAKQSTGPKTLVGKARSKRNAWKHGLSTPINVQPQFVDLVQTLELNLDMETKHVLPRDDVHAIAVGMLEVLRARSVRTLLLEQLAQQCSERLTAGSDASKNSFADLMQHVLRADRYERRALSRRNRAIRSFTEAVKRAGQSVLV